MSRFELRNKKMILASGSPRRRELMEKLRLPFEVEVSDVDESIPDEITTEGAAEYLSGVKAEAVYELHKHEDVIVVGADTIVVYDGEIYGKPKDEADAYRMLRTLSGKTHLVITGVTVMANDAGKEYRRSFSNVTKVTFYELSEDEIRDYIATGEPSDKAGAYGIQEQGALLVKHIEGDFYSVMGLPIAELAHVLDKLI